MVSHVTPYKPNYSSCLDDLKIKLKKIKVTFSGSPETGKLEQKTAQGSSLCKASLGLSSDCNKMPESKWLKHN